MIPEDKKEAVARALNSAFGVSHFQDITQLTAGHSTALVFRIVVKSRSYVLRIIMNRDAISDPTYQFACMTSAAAAGLAPRILYTSIEDRISITDFVEAQPFSRADALIRMPAALKALHRLPPFPKVISFLDFVDRYITRFRAADILPESETAELFNLYAKIPIVYPRSNADLVSSHNDLKPENLLFDGTRVWLVDWEAAFMNDTYFDLAVVANFIVTNDAEEEELLGSYFGQPAGEYRRARFYLMRQVVNMSYSIVFALIGASGKPIQPSTHVPDFFDFHNAIWSGHLSLATNEMRLQYGLVHMKQLLQNMRSDRFKDALHIVSSRRLS